MKGVRDFPGPFQVMTGTGPKIVLPNRFADEMKNQPDVNFAGAFAKDFFTDYPGFEAFKLALEDESFIADVVRIKLTQSLGLITEDLVEETTAAVHDIFGENGEWHETLVKQNILDLVARLSSRVFLGKPLCRNKRWLEIAKGYTVNAFLSARILRMLPSLVRPFVHWVLPPYIKLRRDTRDAEKLIMPEVEMRKERAAKALEAGQKPPKTADTIGWMYEIAKERAEQKNYVAAQLSLTLAAIHTTSEAMTQALLDLCEHPEMIQPIRDEVIQVIGEEGWSKQALYKLRLLDSFLKESQRIHPPSAGTSAVNCLYHASSPSNTDKSHSINEQTNRTTHNPLRRYHPPYRRPRHGSRQIHRPIRLRQPRNIRSLSLPTRARETRKGKHLATCHGISITYGLRVRRACLSGTFLCE